MLGTPLYTAILEKSMKTPERTLALINADNEIIKSKSDTNETYLHLISKEYSGDEDASALIPVVFQLSNAGIDVNATDTSGNNALHVAAQRDKTRKLLRALLMVGVDPLAQDSEKKTPLKLAKPFPENLKILNFLSPGLWNAVEQNSEEIVKTLVSNWCKINEKKNQITILSLAERVGNNNLRGILVKMEKTNTFVHFALAGDRQKMRPFFKLHNVSIDTFSSSFIDESSGDFIKLPLIGEVALLGLTNVARKLLRKKASLIFFVKKSPLYLYIMQNIKPIEEFYEMLEILLDKVDFVRNKSDTSEVLDAAYDKKLPISVLRTMTSKGLDLFLADDDGHFLRDRILMQNATETPKTILKEIAYVDKIVIDMASNGCIDMIRGLIERSYEYIDVVVEDEGSVRAALAKSLGDSKAETFLKEADEAQKCFRQVCHVITIGHLAQVQSLLTGNVLKISDRLGRSLVHRSVLFERRHVLRYLLKIKPSLATSLDNTGRSPLFMACALEDGEDMELALKAMGCKMDFQDKNGVSPSDIKAMTPKEKKKLVMQERQTDYGMDTYLFFKYMDIKEAIRAADLSKVEEIRADIYRDILTNDISTKMYQTSPPQRDILQFAMDARRDKIAKYLLTMGMAWDVRYKEGDEDMSLLEAAKMYNMTAVIGYIQYQIEKVEKHKQLIKKLKSKGVVKNVKNGKTASDKQNTEEESTNFDTEAPADNTEEIEESKTCSLQ